jgi:tRNA(fMet)-specific endonuclease VapC
LVSARWLLDTNALSEPLKPDANRAFMQRLAAHHGAVAICSTTWNEALFGLERLPPGRRRQIIEDYLSEVAAAVPILPYDRDAAAWHAKERARLGRLGLTPPFADGQIAAVCVQHGLTLVSRNRADFAHFAELVLEDWCG